MYNLRESSTLDLSPFVLVGWFMDLKGDKSRVELSLRLYMILSTLLQSFWCFILPFLVLPTEFHVNGGKTTAMTAGGCAMLGLWIGGIVGLITEYYTSQAYRPVREIAESMEVSASTGLIYDMLVLRVKHLGGCTSRLSD